MLTATFQLFTGLGEAAERRLWERGCLLWEHIPRLRDKWLSPAKKRKLAPQIQEARTALDAALPDYFLNRLHGLARLRLLPHFGTHTIFLDIETTGLQADATITTVAVFDGERTNVYVEHANMCELIPVLASAKLLVTYNGMRFDLPRLRKRFGIDLVTPHLDLMPVLGAIGLKGGMKSVERQLGIGRESVEEMDGADAVVLWHAHRQEGDLVPLHRLLRYNALDARNLERMARMLYKRSMQGFPLLPKLPATPSTTPVWFQTQRLFDI
ncbi:MAG: ribonuclease H-like domain-containing protein [Lentisphaeria bacterium]|nr:ribonuclease H-like domain-containing protein [Lentisphaeria bacterium]